MDLFALDEELALWEAELPYSEGEHRLMLLSLLAWQLRQRDGVRSAQLVAEATPLAHLLPAAERRVLAARWELIKAETSWLDGDLDTACAIAERAMLEFARHNDRLGAADTHSLLAWIAVDRGDSAGCDNELALAIADARASGDAMRIDIFESLAALFSVFRNAPAANERWRKRFAIDLAGRHPVVAGWISDYLGTAAFQAAEFGRAISHLIAAFEAALISGQVRRAVILATNIGNAFTRLNAHDAALEWMQRGLELARPTGWPMCIGLTQMQSAETMRHLGQRRAAKALLRDALQMLAPLSGSRTFVMALEYQGDLALDLGDYAAALASFRELEQRGHALAQSDFHSGARRGQAHALAGLGRMQEAQAAAMSALALARELNDPFSQIAALRVLADIHAGNAMSVLQYLREALTIAATIDGYIVPGELLASVAREYAALGDFARAYEFSVQANAARDRSNSQEATNRAIAMQVQHQTERDRQLAAAEVQRAEVLAQTSATLSHLSAIGQEITAQLDALAVFRALDRHVHGLLDSTHFSIFLLERDGDFLHCAFGVEMGLPLPPTRIALSDPQFNTARCVRERNEILIEIEDKSDTPNLIPGTLPTLTLLFAPLMVGERVLGVMTVQSMLPRAYGERERLIFRTLCAYGAIALDNAAAQAQLLEKNLELERAYKALEEVSLTDQLTGLRNRRFFLQHVESDVALSLRGYDGGEGGAGSDLVFYMVDLDHFKAVNDRHGHAAGDCVLVQMKDRLREVFRESDYLVRWGGEEFLVLARATDRSGAHVVAERIRQAVSSRDFVLPDGTPLARTCSIGFACYPFLPSHPRLMSWSQVVELADLGLYISKHSGRDAWTAVHATDAARPEELFPRLVHQLAECVERGEARIVTSLGERTIICP
ncbi:sensor domain-containing diguanylate cyclase [Duganella sp. Root1480D1]|uniref:sensor domain-containing diguanylate cyclase n=1 Tax=Duganella sp. Root1480D1 TaxID=1736471 RepID=UPI00070CB62F|nr:sensor domain-containing diguanylate cyclase [Duganella sp. Root1480D1]KQZ27623.1 histidine kinase [Duganella sp. Root1480D1]